MTAINDQTTPRNYNWAQIKPLEDKRIHIGCLCCSSVGRIAHPNLYLGVGFGEVVVTKGNECVYSETQWNHEGKDCWTLQDAEALASVDPDHDWRIQFDGPLHGETYQRHKSGHWAGKWVLIESNQGFA